MLDQTGSRHSTRMDESGEISYKFPDAGQSYIAECLNISGSGILFRSKQFIENGRALEVTIAGQNALTSAMIAYVEVIRTNEVEPDVYKIVTEIKGIKEN